MDDRRILESIYAHPANTARNRLGLWVSFAGIDGTGKSTHSKLLTDWFLAHNLQVKIVPTPSRFFRRYSVIRKVHAFYGGDYESYVSPEVITLCAAFDHLRVYDGRIRPLRMSGVSVINDGFVLKTMAISLIEGVDTSWVMNVFRYHMKLPDLVFVLTASQRIISERLASRHSATSLEVNSEFLKRLNQELVKLARRYGFLIIDTSKPINQVQRTLRMHVVANLHGHPREQ